MSTSLMKVIYYTLLPDPKKAIVSRVFVMHLRTRHRSRQLPFTCILQMSATLTLIVSVQYHRSLKLSTNLILSWKLKIFLSLTEMLIRYSPPVVRLTKQRNASQ